MTPVMIMKLLKTVFGNIIEFRELSGIFTPSVYMVMQTKPITCKQIIFLSILAISVVLEYVNITLRLVPNKDKLGSQS